MSSYYDEYIKYKTKYIALKQRGGCTLSTTSFKDGGPMGLDFPDLKWTPPPKEAKELVITCVDPDAAQVRSDHTPFVHYLAWSDNPKAKINGFTVGKNSAGENSYHPPSPPKNGGPHHYIFTLYVLNKDVDLGLDQEYTAAELKSILKPATIFKSSITGTYENK